MQARELRIIDPVKIQSFIRRQGRMTAGQKYALENYWGAYCLSFDEDTDLIKVYGRKAPLILEIGFGDGNSLAEMAEANPGLNFLGVEVHKPGVGHLMMLLKQRDITNVRIYCHDAIEVLERKIPNDSLNGVQLFFPDPWQKRRHHKRRIVRPAFVALLYQKLVSGGYFHTATDWEQYAMDIVRMMSSVDGFCSTSCSSNDYCARPDYRPLTKFENRGLALGHGIWDMIYRKV